VSKVYDIVYPQSYTSNGEEKTKWINCGAVFDSNGKMSAKLDSIPVGFDGWFKFFEPKPRQDSPPAPAQNTSPPAAPSAPAVQDDLDDSIPF
jgi:hypothetical protein